MENKDGGPAFPMLHSFSNPDDLNSYRCENIQGMSLRDYFAAQALQGIMANAHILSYIEGRYIGSENEISERAFALASSMLEARKK